MNVVFIQGKVISDVIFKCIIGKRRKSISKFTLELENKSNIIIIAYDEKADYCYQKVLKHENVLIQGKINSNMEIEVECVYKI